MAITKNKSDTETLTTFRKEQFLKSKKYVKYHDLIDALLDDKKQYTITQVDKAIENYLKGGKK